MNRRNLFKVLGISGVALAIPEVAAKEPEKPKPVTFRISSVSGMIQVFDNYYTCDDGFCVRYYNFKGQLHREDGPAIEHASGGKYWYLNGQLHREDGPAIEYASGSKEWYLNGQKHRIDGPAIEFASGNKVWYLNGKFIKEIHNA